MTLREETRKRAVGTERIGLAAVEFAGLDEERVEFVEELGVAGEVGFEEGADLFVGTAGIGLSFERQEVVAFEDPARIGVDYEYGMLTGVEKDGVGGFGADSADGEELVAQRCCGRGEETVERT
jgi:hypothetical protein